MEAKDTVMKPKDIEAITRGKTLRLSHNTAICINPYPQEPDIPLEKVLTEAQAEISFKVGKTAGVAETLIPSLKAIEASRRAGIKEVLSYRYTEDNQLEVDGTVEVLIIPRAKLKAWGV